jgi:glycine/D-amino acid oxidase-like deaminating enzyme
MAAYDVLIVGGGLVGMAVAHGLARRGVSTAVIDEGDTAFRASHGNFGLVWVQSKGDGMPAYAAWTRSSADLWPTFAEELRDLTGMDVAYSKPGGVHICFDERELAEERALGERLKAATEAPGYQFEMLDHKQLSAMLPGLGRDVLGGSHGPNDGHCNPLGLLHALRAGFMALGGTCMSSRPVRGIRPSKDGVSVIAGDREVHGARLVLAAGLGNIDLAPLVGLRVPIRPVRGQILVSERLHPILRMPTTFVRQTADGSFLFGDSHEEVGYDVGTTSDVMRDIARNATRTFPFLADVRVVRVWGALRPLPVDGFPFYDRSPEFPHCFSLNCHSGVTLAAAHSAKLAGWIAGEETIPDIDCFSADRIPAGEAE